jgi:hypothetical protein
LGIEYDSNGAPPFPPIHHLRNPHTPKGEKKQKFFSHPTIPL